MGKASRRKQIRKQAGNVVIVQAGVAAAQGNTGIYPEPEKGTE